MRANKEAKGVHPRHYEEFELAHLEVRGGRERNESLRNMVDRTGVDDLRSLVVYLDPGRSLQQIDHKIRLKCYPGGQECTRAWDKTKGTDCTPTAELVAGRLTPRQK